MLELEIEKEEQTKNLKLLQELRQKERDELNAAVERAKSDGGNYAE